MPASDLQRGCQRAASEIGPDGRREAEPAAQTTRVFWLAVGVPRP